MLTKNSVGIFSFSGRAKIGVRRPNQPLALISERLECGSIQSSLIFRTETVSVHGCPRFYPYSSYRDLTLPYQNWIYLLKPAFLSVYKYIELRKTLASGGFLHHSPNKRGCWQFSLHSNQLSLFKYKCYTANACKNVILPCTRTC